MAAPALVRVRPSSVSSSLVSPARPILQGPLGDGGARAVHRAAGPDRRAADGQRARAGEVAARLVQGAGGRTVVELDRAAVDVRGACDAVANAPEVNRKSPLGTSTMPGPPMPAPVPSVKSPSNSSVQPAATVKLAGERACSGAVAVQVQRAGISPRSRLGR